MTAQFGAHFGRWNAAEKKLSVTIEWEENPRESVDDLWWKCKRSNKKLIDGGVFLELFGVHMFVVVICARLGTTFSIKCVINFSKKLICVF